MASSPEVKKRLALKKIESDLRTVTPAVYRNDLVQENLAEAWRLMYINTKPVLNVLLQTISGDDFERNRRFEEQLLLTGFPPEIQDILDSLSYENRKAGAREADSLSRFMETERRQLDKVIRYLNTPEFIQIDSVIDRLRQLADVCKFSYLAALRIFDATFSAADPDHTSFQPVPAELLESMLMDFYYVGAGMDITTSVSNALIALCQLANRNTYTEEMGAGLQGNLKKIQSLFRHVFTPETMTNLIRLSKKDPEFVPKQAAYQANTRKKYAEYLEHRFEHEGARMKGELQDETITSELHEVFGAVKLPALQGYNQELNGLLMQNSPVAFTFVLPMQILKGFLQIYYEPHIKPLLNDIAIEGYFNNTAYKSEFSGDVYALNDGTERIKKFEEKFQRNGDFDETNLTSLLRDSHKDVGLGGQLKTLVDKINKLAKDIIQTEVNNIFQVYKLLGELLVEAKKANSDVIANLKVLMLSSRNRDNSELLEKQYGLWKLFLEIMKNYVIISNVEKSK